MVTVSKKKNYIGEKIRKHIKTNRLTNGYVIKHLSDNGIIVSDSKFSNKLYGIRDSFTEQEIEVINKLFFIKDF